MAYRGSKFNAYCLLTCREQARLIVLLLPTHCDLASRSSSSKQHVHIGHPYVYRRAKFECNSLNIVCDIAIVFLFCFYGDQGAVLFSCHNEGVLI